MGKQEEALPTNASAYVSIRDAARILAVSPRTLYKSMYAGRLPGVTRFGRAVRIHRATLDRRALSGQVLLDAPEPTDRP
jgi:excisionase family DNA binding protein